MTDLYFKRIDIEKLSKPPEKGGLYNIVKNNYWLIDKNGYGLKFKNYSYQRNINKNICEKFIGSEIHPAVEVKFFETIYLPYK